MRALGFGDVDLSLTRMVEQPEGDWARLGFNAGPINSFIIRDAIIHSAAGLIVLDDVVIAETLHHANPGICGFERTPDGKILLRSHGTVRTTERLVHLLGGGADNYYHWMLDILSRAVVCGQLPETQGAVRLLPPIHMDFQTESIQLLAQRESWRIGQLANFETVHVEEMIFVPTITGWGFRPHPRLLQLCRQIRKSTLVGLGRPSRRLYIDRRDALHRPLLNERELMAALTERGVEILSLEAMPLHAQIAAFAQAAIVVAPHGAGLVNLLFSLPGVRVVELMMDSYVNWCFRNLAALKAARYGCVIGKTEGAWDPGWPHNKAWTIKIPRVIEAVEAALAAA